MSSQTNSSLEPVLLNKYQPCEINLGVISQTAPSSGQTCHSVFDILHQ